MWKDKKANRRQNAAVHSRQRSASLVAALMMFCAWVPSTLIRRPADLGGEGSVAASGPKRYELKGVVMSVDRSNQSATIKHEKVDDYMPPMTMSYKIKDDKAIGEMRAGDGISATLVVIDGREMWLENVVITSRTANR
jgi:Cu/Ag efflux protein CusF